MALGNRASKKFSFPLPRRLRDKPEDSHPDTRSIPSIASGPDRPLRHDESSSKAHQILGTSDSLHRSTTGQTSIPASPGYISITVSDASPGPQFDDRNSATTTENSGHSRRPDMSRKPSSNVLGRMYSGDGRRDSDYSSLSPRLYAQSSNGTLRSHYDAKKSPMAISQQTSDSAIRDRALRRGQPPVLTDHGYEIYEPSPVSPVILNEKKKESRKSKPVRLDLSKLFPKPRESHGQEYGGPLLSPSKMVNSPAAMSVNSGYFPRVKSRESTLHAGPAKLQKANTKHHAGSLRPQPSPVPSSRYGDHESAKVNVRRPPRGVQHWFDALDEDSEEDPENTQRLPTPKASGTYASYKGSSAGQMSPARETTLYASRPQELSVYKRDSFALEDLVDMTHLASPSQHSLSTFHSRTSSKTKASVLAKKNLQDSSILSFSSSEDEPEERRSKVQTGPTRQSLEMGDYRGNIVNEQAQAHEARQHRRRPSAGGMSTLSTSTNAATIEVMYTPEPRFSPHHNSRSSTYGSNKRSSHIRQPSVIHEDDDARPQTAFETNLAPSIHSVTSAHTSTSAPQSYPDKSHKFMQVTAEEEALLELMRKKRAAMNKYCSPPAHTQEYDDGQKPRPEATGQPPRTSAFLSMESLESSPVRVTDANSRQRAATDVATPPHSHARGRSAKINISMSQLRDSSASDTWSDRHYSPVSRGRLPHYLPPPAEFSPLDPFPQSSPTFATSITSPNSEDNASPLPSPITPGPRAGEADVAVRVASSVTSNEPYDMTLVMRAPSVSTKSDSSPEFGSHRRRRTASSDAEITFPAPPTSIGFRDLTSVSEASSRAPSIVEPPMQKIAKKKAPRHISELAIASIETRSRQSSINSTSRSSVYSQASSYHQPSASNRRSRHLSPDSSFTSHPRATTSEDRDSVSEDVLAAWNSLGGTY
ncbi:proteophosphoglycan ppg1 [Pyrenophora seminiperda CCB06]|uniref:Proteophosphoglycan ppg1 n=1 Tax=Pyrenophora seminiperda CCB06 TaxID=1302712 RepID=A0A3M7LZE4_9PLEO|nr:proteophosphoglycan ppg1 [Pyrenophora seminiperda CCB06]